MLAIEERLKAQDFAERVKLAIVSADPKRWMATMFPQWYPSKTKTERDAEGAEEVVLQGDEEIDDTTGRWVFTDEDVTPEQVMREMAEAGQMSAGIADLGEWSEWRE